MRPCTSRRWLSSRAEVRGTPYAGRHTLDDYIKPNPFLTSVSIIEAEISPRGSFPFLARELEPIAREIFANPKVEVATHTYSHPFFMQPDKAKKRENFNRTRPNRRCLARQIVFVAKSLARRLHHRTYHPQSR